jgi:L-ribulose-5-phosphate 3-epimerase UlaE
MKLLIVAAIKEDTEIVSEILKKASIPIFSVTDTMGIKNGENGEMLDNWFGRGTGKFDSIFIFCFTTEQNVENAFQALSQYNASQNSTFPVRAFVLPVEKSLY